jgi:hypothetical protein
VHGTSTSFSHPTQSVREGGEALGSKSQFSAPKWWQSFTYNRLECWGNPIERKKTLFRSVKKTLYHSMKYWFFKNEIPSSWLK